MTKPLIAIMALCLSTHNAAAQTAPSASEIAAYDGLHRAAHTGNVKLIRSLGKAAKGLNARDQSGRTPAHVATFASNDQALAAVIKAGGDPNAFDNQRYDIVTIAAVANDLAIMKLALSLGCKAGNITSPYDGTALIAAAHLGHVEIVQALIEAKAPLDHVNNLGWTALIEAVVLGDGGPRHIATARALILAGANVNIADRQGVTPLAHAKARGYQAMVALFPK